MSLLSAPSSRRPSRVRRTPLRFREDYLSSSDEDVFDASSNENTMSPPAPMITEEPILPPATSLPDEVKAQRKRKRQQLTDELAATEKRLRQMQDMLGELEKLKAKLQQVNDETEAEPPKRKRRNNGKKRANQRADMTPEQKKKLYSDICQLDPQKLQRVVELINELSPNALICNEGGEVEIDIHRLPPATQWGLSTLSTRVF